MFNLLQPLAHIAGKFSVDGQKYEIENFNLRISQPVDRKGQPQHELRGGQIHLTMTHMADDLLYEWAKSSTKLKNGSVLFQTDLGVTVLKIDFKNAYCINLIREINAMTGTSTSLIIAPEEVIINGEKHNNFWSK